MVYRGKPSAGCEACRKAKKRCDLGQPACSRCVKLRKICLGYRDTSQIQIQDESEAVKRKVNRLRYSQLTVQSTSPGNSATSSSTASSPAASPPTASHRLRNDNTVKYAIPHNDRAVQRLNHSRLRRDRYSPGSKAITIPATIKPSISDVAANYFFAHFTSRINQWDFLRDPAEVRLAPELDLGLRACGMAALDNVKGVGVGLARSRVLYARALKHLNAALRDPQLCKTNESLMAVSLLGYYENLTCDGFEALYSWKLHTRGAAQLIKLRGPSQLETMTGRLLYRETRAQIMISSIWDDQPPPRFIRDWNDALKQYPDYAFAFPIDSLVMICADYATLKHKIRNGRISNADAVVEVVRIEMAMIQWSTDTMDPHGFWCYQEIKVPASPHIYNGLVHGYRSLPAVAGTWNTYRTVRIMLTRTQEDLVRKFELSAEDMAEQMAYFWSVRQQMMDDICSSVPPLLGHGAPALLSPSILSSANGVIWPLFFVGICVLERVDPRTWAYAIGEAAISPQHHLHASIAQAVWIMGRMRYISDHIGLRWAEAALSMMKGNVPVPDRVLSEWQSSDLPATGDNR